MYNVFIGHGPGLVVKGEENPRVCNLESRQILF